eukprot:CAMPEP_0172531816 /NCGR_PEP_ID=MMETSP1067-20121228/5070_1 /TAXON_ID=265564 ORGANISM="Thalassiosira punctigera, Strain Tpunct2005C2" /NCGR_SAMPLE_ID=MMETSP1067 /ASSEMBLY_ACC=CAM_ASM_000444 /LENGTH=78 /DNA_ID=CAMNT_0013316245 /DNA_START=165 /DNA_END=401 /DNA_ORIENTATION=+
MGGEWYKKTYAYAVFSAGMSAYIARFMWNHAARLDQSRDFRDVIGCRVVGAIMALMAILQGCINIGLIGDMWDKRKRA